MFTQRKANAQLLQRFAVCAKGVHIRLFIAQRHNGAFFGKHLNTFPVADACADKRNALALQVVVKFAC